MTQSFHVDNHQPAAIQVQDTAEVSVDDANLAETEADVKRSAFKENKKAGAFNRKKVEHENRISIRYKSIIFVIFIFKNYLFYT